MKLVVTGATGFVATEIIRQSLSIPKITSVIALARRPVSPPLNLSPAADASKLHSAVLDNYGSYPDHVIKQLAGADACIWYAHTRLSFLPQHKLISPPNPGLLPSHRANRPGSTLKRFAVCVKSMPSSAFEPFSKRTARVAVLMPHLFASYT